MDVRARIWHNALLACICLDALTRLFVLLTLYLARSLLHPSVESIKQRPILLPSWVDTLLFTDLVILSKVLVEVCFELLVSDEALATIGALKFDLFIQLRYGDKIKSIEWLLKVKKTYSFKACGQCFKTLKLNSCYCLSCG